jgi:hypothetical protein
MANAFENIQCLPLRNVWVEAVDQGICTSGFNGLLAIWISSLINSLMLFGAMVSATIFMPMLVDQSTMSTKEADEGEINGVVEESGVNPESKEEEQQTPPEAAKKEEGKEHQQQHEQQDGDIEMLSENSLYR